MATTTPNFGWSVPTSTDLVKDGATAIETLGDSIDASLVDLKGGTTNQVLAKNSNTDMDFKWVADAAGMTNPMTTTGDTIYSSSGSTPARLGIGTAGQVLTVNSGATAPEWQAAPTGGMTLISTTTLGSTSTTISSIPSTYKDLQLIFRNVTSGTANIAMQFQFNSDTGSNYVYSTANGSNAGLTAYYGWDFGTYPLAGSSPYVGSMTIFDYANTATSIGKIATSNFTVQNTATPNYRNQVVVGTYLTASAISSVTIKTFASGTIGGSVLLYGVK